MDLLFPLKCQRRRRCRRGRETQLPGRDRNRQRRREDADERFHFWSSGRIRTCQSITLRRVSKNFSELCDSMTWKIPCRSNASHTGGGLSWIQETDLGRGFAVSSMNLQRQLVSSTRR